MSKVSAFLSPPNQHPLSRVGTLLAVGTFQLRVPLYAVPGDHDLRNGLGLFTKYLEPVPYQSFSADRYHFVFMDALDASASGGFGIGQEQLAWLSNDLAQASQRNDLLA